VADINPGESSSLPERLAGVDGRLYFAARDGTHGQELWALVWPQLSISKAMEPVTLISPGDTLTFTLSFSNAGLVDATGVEIGDVVPAELSSVSYQASTGLSVTPTGSVPYTWEVEDLAPDEGGVITVTGVVDAGLPPGYVFTNTASIAADADLGNLVDDVAQVRVVINSPPVAVDDRFRSLRDQPLAASAPGVLSNDTDMDGNPLTAVIDSPPSIGTLALAPDGGLVYTPTQGFAGTVTFTYLAHDGRLESELATAYIAIVERILYLPVVVKGGP
jgi:uncharacterized repeat protein (TIGR01451 family)